MTGTVGKIRDAVVILNISFLIVLVVSILKFSSIISAGNSSAAILSLVMYSVYGVIAFFIPKFSVRPGFETAIIKGTVTGIIAGILLTLKFTADHLLSQDNRSLFFLSPVLLVLTFLLYWAASLMTMLKTRNIAASLFAGIWSSMAASVLLVAAVYIFLFVAPRNLESHYFLHFQSSGMENISAFVIHAIAAEGSKNMLTSPVVALVFGATAVIVIQISDKIKKQ